LLDNESENEQQPLSERSIIAYVEGKLDESRRAANRTAHESLWLTNSAWLLGYQNLTWSQAERMYRTIDTLGVRKMKLQTNRILPTLQNRTARMCKLPPKYEVRPNSSEVEDKEGAELGISIINHYWDAEDLNRKRIDLYMWKQQCGHAYVKVCWDADKGRKMQDPMTGEVIKEGDIRIDVVSAFELYPDPVAKTLDECAFVIHAKVRPLNYFKSTYGEKGMQIKEEQVSLMGLQYQQRINSMNAQGGSETANSAIKNCAVEKVYYEAPSIKYPEGRMITWCGQTLLDDKPLPVGEIPFVKFDDIIVGGKYYSEAIVTHMRPVQEQINILINKRASWVNKLIAGKYSVPRGAGLAQEAMDDESGEIVEYDPVPNAADGGRPQPVQVPMIPQYAYTEEDRLLNALYEIAGVSDVARGQIPSSSISGVGMQILLEADATRIGIITEADEHSWAKVGRLILLYAQKYIQNERLLKQASNQGYRVSSFLGADIKDNTDVIVRRGSTLPNSQAMMRQDILNIYERGLFGDPADAAVRENVLGLLEFGDVQEAWKKQNLDQMQIKKVIEKLEQGIPSYPTDFDNSPLWLQKLNEYRLGDKFEKLAPQIQAMLMDMMEACITQTLPQSHKAPPVPQQQEPQALGQEPQGEVTGL
jgi:hypothetical protein